jgi:hypothetical protein
MLPSSQSSSTGAWHSTDLGPGLHFPFTDPSPYSSPYLSRADLAHRHARSHQRARAAVRSVPRLSASRCPTPRLPCSLSGRYDPSVACSGTPAHLALMRRRTRPSASEDRFRASFGLGARLDLAPGRGAAGRGPRSPSPSARERARSPCISAASRTRVNRWAPTSTGRRSDGCVPRSTRV